VSHRALESVLSNDRRLDAREDRQTLAYVMANQTGRVATDEGLIARDDAKVLASNDWLNDFFTHFDGEESPFDIAAAFDVGTGTLASGIQEKPVGVTSTAGEECPKKRKAEDGEEKVEANQAQARSYTLSEGARKTKSTREKRRRDVLNSRFEELIAVLEPGSMMKADKATVVVAATQLIKQLRAEHSRLANMIMHFKEDNIRQAESTRTLAAERDALVKEKTELLHEKLRIEAQLQGFLASMPFASPVEGVTAPAAKTMRGNAAWTVPTPFLPANEEAEEDVTLRAPVA